jgi:hypothetical protein
MIQKQLTRAQRWCWGALSGISILFAIIFAVQAATAPIGFPLPARLGFVAGVVFSLAFAVIGFRVYRQRFITLTDTGAYSSLAWILPTIFVTLAMLYAPDNLLGLRTIICGFVFLLMGAVFLLRNVVEQSEARLREKLTELEKQLSQFRAEIGKSRK